MEHTAKNWKIERTCSNCGHKDEIYVTKREAAFELVKINDVLGNTCSHCSSTIFTTAYEMPDLDFDLLKEWATSSELYLIEQDEELLLADEKYLDMILQVLDTIPIHEHKRNVLLDALCVIVYDNTLERNPKADKRLRSRVIEELNKRQEILKLADGFIIDYVKKVVYPQLAIGRPNAV
jgi:hypothetical protein